MDHSYRCVDVFGSGPLSGNPVAVVHDADDLDDEQMAAFARWTNLSETTFLLAPTDPAADYRLRIFTPGEELPFAGHPTLGSAHACPGLGVTEDPVTGSLQAGLAQWLTATGRLTAPYVAAQGAALRRRGRVHVEVVDGVVRVAGATSTTIVGQLRPGA